MTAASDPIGKYSVWLVPEEPQRSTLQSEIDRLAGNLNKPAFIPHLTVLGDIEADAGMLGGHLQAVSSRLAQMSLCAKRVETGATYYQSLFLEVDEHPWLAGLRGELGSLLAGVLHDYGQAPHISLAYGSVPPGIVEGTRLAFASALPMALTFSSLALVNSCKDIPVENWAIMRSFACCRS